MIDYGRKANRHHSKNTFFFHAEDLKIDISGGKTDIDSMLNNGLYVQSWTDGPNMTFIRPHALCARNI